MPHTRAFILAAAIAFGTASGADAGTPVLRTEAAITGDLVRIGDLIEHAGALADVAIFRAPDPGHTGAVSTARVLDAVRPHGLHVVDTRGVREVMVTRLSRSLSVKEIEARVASAFAGRRGLGEGRNFSLSFDREVRPLQLDATASELKVARASYDPATTRFDVTFEVAGSAARRLALRYTGTLVETVEVATLARPLGRGDVIRPSDVTIERRPKAQVAGGALVQLDQVVGLAARRALPAAQPLRAADLMKPELVRQNETVTVTYETAGLSLTVRGKALEAGAEGDMVNVLNVQSKRTMQGAVTGPGRVTIAVTTPQILANDPPATSSVAASATPQRTE